jgi:hypothetical protein
MERHLAFLVDCRATFGRFNDLKVCPCFVSVDDLMYDKVYFP